MRVFLGLDVPMAIRSQLVLQQALMPVKRRQPPENFHITLVYLGESLPDQLDDLDTALSRLDVAPFWVQIAGLGLFGKAQAHNLHAKVTPTPDLIALREKLLRVARAAGFSPEARRFVPHVTLAYLAPGQFSQPDLELAIVRDTSFRTEPFEVSDVVLYRAHQHRKGAQYDALERYSLSAVGRALKQ